MRLVWCERRKRERVSHAREGLARASRPDTKPELILDGGDALRAGSRSRFLTGDFSAASMEEGGGGDPATRGARSPAAVKMARLLVAFFSKFPVQGKEAAARDATPQAWRNA